MGYFNIIYEDELGKENSIGCVNYFIILLYK